MALKTAPGLKAIVQHRYGTPDVLALEIDRLAVGDEAFSSGTAYRRRDGAITDWLRKRAGRRIGDDRHRRFHLHRGSDSGSPIDDVGAYSPHQRAATAPALPRERRSPTPPIWH